LSAELPVLCLGSSRVPGSLIGLSDVAVVGTFVGSAAGLLFVSRGFGEVIAGADVWTGNPESTVDLGVAAGDVVAECNVGVAIASAGCNALGANAADQQCHLDNSFRLTCTHDRTALRTKHCTIPTQDPTLGLPEAPQ
jgi:hypothetical protein